MRIFHDNAMLVRQQNKNHLCRRMIACAVIVALISLMQPVPANARYADKYADESASWQKALIVTLIAAGAILVPCIIFGVFGGGSHPKLTATPKRLVFGKKPIGTKGEHTVDLINEGQSGLEIISVSVSGDCFSLVRPPENVPRMFSKKERIQVVVGFTAKEKVCKGELQVETRGEKKSPRVFRLPMEVHGLQ